MVVRKYVNEEEKMINDNGDNHSRFGFYCTTTSCLFVRKHWSCPVWSSTTSSFTLASAVSPIPGMIWSCLTIFNAISWALDQ